MADQHATLYQNITISIGVELKDQFEESIAVSFSSLPAYIIYFENGGQSMLMITTNSYTPLDVNKKSLTMGITNYLIITHLL